MAPFVVDVDWASSIRQMSTTPTLQVVVNPLLRRFTPMHDQIFQSLKDLEADYVRFVPWFPYPRLGVAQLQRPTTTQTFWDFSLIDPLMEDFMNATDGHSRIINFSTEPRWLYGVDTPIDADPNAVQWSYPQGTTLVDPTMKEVGDYYGRLVAYYTKGGFTDELGKQVHSAYNFDIQFWEVLNEVESEHRHTKESYTQKYDAVVKGIRRHADPEGKIKFVGLALAYHNEWDWYNYFLNHSNHAEGVPLDFISYHFYGSPSSRTDVTGLPRVFDQANGFIDEVQKVIDIRDKLSPETKMTIDEIGCILPDDNNRVSDSIPDLYWNAAGAMYAYLFGRLSSFGVDVLGQSQLVGYPAFPGLGLPDAQFPSVALLDWNTGYGNARYHILKMLIDNFKDGDFKVMNTKLPVQNPFCASINNLEDLTIGCTEGGVINKILFASYGTPEGQCGSWKQGSCHADNSTDIVTKYCLGKQQCTIPATTAVFGDPCYGTVKSLVVEASCSSGGQMANWDSMPCFAQGYLSEDGLRRRVLLINKTLKPLSLKIKGLGCQTMQVVDAFTGMQPPREEQLDNDVVQLNAMSVAILH